MELKLPNTPENVQKAHNVARLYKDMHGAEMEVITSYDWIVIREASTDEGPKKEK